MMEAWLGYDKYDMHTCITNVINISIVKHIKLFIHVTNWLCRDMPAVSHGDLVFVIEACGMDRVVWCTNTSDLCEPLSIVLGSLSCCK